MRRLWGRGFAVGAVLILTVLLAGAARAAPRSDGVEYGPEVRVATSGDFSERLDRLPIRRHSAGAGQVVISLTPKRLPSIAAGDRLEVSAEVQVTVDCHKPGPRCLGEPYEYNPDLEFGFVLGTSATDAGAGGTAVAIGTPRRDNCRQRPPNREHHCVVVFSRTLPLVPADAPCLQSRCYLNLVGSATDPAAGGEDVVALGGLRPDGSVPQDRARLNVVRVHPAGEVAAVETSLEPPATSELHLDQRREVVYTQPLELLRAHEQLEVEATVRFAISHLPYNVVLASQLILTDEPDATDRDLAKSVASLRGELTEGNAFNCTQNLRLCTVRKVGVLEMKRDAVRGGQPVTLYATLVTNAGPKQLEAKPGDRVRVLGGSFDVTRYPPEVRG